MDFLEEAQAKDRRYVYLVMAICFFLAVAENVIEEYVKKINFKAVSTVGDLTEYYMAPGIPIFNP